MLNIPLGKRIKLLREDNGYTIGELASKVKITRQGLSRIEKSLCLPSPHVVSDLANALEVTMDFLIDGDELSPIKSPDAQSIKIVTPAHTDNYIKNNIINK